MRKWTLSGVLVLAAAVLFSNTAFASEKALAEALSATGAAHSAAGHIEQAKDMLFKALAYDEECGDAIFELAKIFEKEGAPVAAGDFYQRAILLLAQDARAPATAKRGEAEKRLKVLNPYAPRLTAAFEEFAQDVDRVVKRVNDGLTQDAAGQQVADLGIANVLPADKMPKFYAAYEAKVKAHPPEANTGAGDNPPPPTPQRSSSVPPEVEKELKKNGWTKITGTWEKKGPGLYQVTDGKIEAPAQNGAIEFTLLKGDSATVRATVRSSFRKPRNDFFGGGGPPGGGGEFMPGYGCWINGSEYKVFEPNEGGRRGGFGGFGGAAGQPSLVSGYAIPAEAPKNRFMVTINDNTLEVYFNEKRNGHVTSSKTSHSGPFVIEVEGTATLENPRCVGQ